MVKGSGATPSMLPVEQVVRGPIDYLTLDYLAEVTMSILQKQRARDPESRIRPRFRRDDWPHSAGTAERKIRVVANAGGLNPLACRRAVLAAAEKQGVHVRVAAVTGDDISGRLDDLMGRGIEFLNMDTGEPLATVRERVRARTLTSARFPSRKRFTTAPRS